jgi:cyclase
MLAKRIIPVILKRDDSMVKGRQFDSWRVVGHPLQAAKIHATRGVDELFLLDIGATPQNKGPNLGMVRALTNDAYMPVTVGGGIRSMADVRNLLNAGADKIAIGTRASPDFISGVAARYGSQVVCISVDVLGDSISTGCGRQKWFYDPIKYVREMVAAGAGEILLQRVESDGMMTGYDLDMIKKVSGAVDVPVVASCGCGSYEHMAEAIRAGASAVAVGAFFLFTDNTPAGAAKYLESQEIEARVA